MPFRNGKISGVLNSNDTSNNEMSYVDMHDLHPENVQAAQVQGALNGAISGATLAMLPAAIAATFTGTEKTANAEKVVRVTEDIGFTGKGIGIGAAHCRVGSGGDGSGAFLYRQERCRDA